MRILIGLTVLMMAQIGFAKELASFGSTKITEKEFKDAVERLGPQAQMIKSNPQMKQRFLDHLINRKLLADKAKKEKVDKSKKYKEMVEELKMEALSNVYIEDYIAKNTTDKKLKDYFNKNKKKFAKDEVKASHILVKEEKKAKEVLAEAKKKGADFAALAKKHSTGPSGPNGGDLGWFGRGKMVPEFEKAAFVTKKGSVHGNIVKTQFGYHIIKVVDRKGDGKANFKDSKDEIERTLKRELQEGLITDLRTASKVKINDKNLESLKF